MSTPVAGGLQQSWLVTATDVLQDFESGGAYGSALDPIDVTLDFASLVSSSLPGCFWEWITDALECFRDALNDFTGNSSQIVAHAQQCSSLGDQVYGIGTDLSSVSGRTPSWSGRAAEGFAKTSQLAGECTGATGKLIQQLGTQHLIVGGLVADIKLHLITTVLDLAPRLVSFAFDAIKQVGIEIIGGTLKLAASVIAAIGEGAARGSRWGPVGMVVGAIDGAINFDYGAELERRLKEALNSFAEWAADELGRILEGVSDYIEARIDPVVQELGRMKLLGQLAERAVQILQCGKDPGFNASAPDPDSYGATAQGKDPQEMDRDLIDLNRAIGDPNATLPPGYTRATPEELAELGLTPDMLTDENGFKAEVYMYTDADGNTHPVVAFAGTGAGAAPGEDGGFGTDAVEDVIGAGTVSPQTQQVLAISEAISNSPKGDEVVFTGHSLGGRLASIAALDTGNAAVTYNSAGVSQATIDYVAASNNMSPEDMTSHANDGQIRRYTTGDDPLTWAQQDSGIADAAPDALGTQHEISENNDPLFGHTMDVVDDAFDEKYPDSLPDGRD